MNTFYSAKLFLLLILDHSLSGNLINDDMQDSPPQANVRKRTGKGSAFLESKGFGWLLEVQDDDDEDFQKPLLYVLQNHF